MRLFFQAYGYTSVVAWSNLFLMGLYRADKFKILEKLDKFKILENHASSSFILKDGDPCYTELNMDPSNPFGLPSMLPEPQLLAPSVDAAIPALTDP